MFVYLDSQFMKKFASELRAGKKPSELAQQGLRPDFMKRGAIRSVFDGRHRLTRYFAPKQHNRPTSLEELFARNDVELYDLKQDPDEMHNLAVDRKKAGDRIVAMNQKLNELIDQEVETDDGSMLPGDDADWAIETFDI